MACSFPSLDVELLFSVPYECMENKFCISRHATLLHRPIMKIAKPLLFSEKNFNAVLLTFYKTQNSLKSITFLFFDEYNGFL